MYLAEILLIFVSAIGYSENYEGNEHISKPINATDAQRNQKKVETFQKYTTTVDYHYSRITIMTYKCVVA